MKRYLSILVLILSLSRGFAQQKSSFPIVPKESELIQKPIVIAKKKDSFSPIKLITIKNVSQKENLKPFYIGENVQSITDKRYVDTFFMNAYETTYSLWYEIRIQAEAVLNYSFQNPGQEGAGGRRGMPPTKKNKDKPVTSINWRDAIVWCNALSEIEGRTACYSYEGLILRDSSDAIQIDLCKCDFTSNGYRLPTETEWEYASRKTKFGFQRGDLVSGSVDNEGKSDSNANETNFCWNELNSTKTANVATAGSIFGSESLPESGIANALGLYDMSGNVLEFCWDWYEEYYSKSTENKPWIGPSYGSNRVLRGGSWSQFASYCYCGDRYAFDPTEAYNYMGFRFCTSIEN